MIQTTNDRLRKLALIGFASVVSLTAIAQAESIPAPSDADALKRFKTDAELHKMIKERTGYSFAQVKLVKTYDWAKSYTTEGDLRRERWTYDMITKAYDIETPKDANGVYSQYQIFVDYRRSTCSMNGCLMTDTYSFFRYGVGPQYEFGFKEFQKNEKMTLLNDYLKTNKPACLSDVVTISSLDVDDSWARNDISATQQALYFKMTGKLAIYSADYSRIFDIKDFNDQMLKLFVSKKNGVWSADSLMFEDQYDRPYFYRGYQLSELPTSYYRPFKEVGFEGVFNQQNEQPAPTGMYQQLDERTTAFMNMVVSKGESLTVDDVWSYCIPAALRDETDDEVKEELSEEVEINPAAVYIKLLTTFQLQNTHFSYDGYKDRNDNYIYLHNAKTIIAGNVETYKFSKGVAKKGKAIETAKEESFVIEWVYDAQTKTWYILHLNLPVYN
jgi:hypothetical protein